MKVPYIGITGIMDRAQVAAIGATTLNLLYRINRKIMIGVLVSSKTLAGEKNKYPHLFPPVKTLKNIFSPDPRFLNLVHYSTDNPLWLREELSRIINLFQDGKKKNGLNGLNGFQLNIPWPSISHLEDVKAAFPKLKIVLQIGPTAFEQARHSPEKVMEMAGDYLPFVDHFLLDPSAGLGKPVDAEMLLPYLRELSYFVVSGLGVADGLGPGAILLAEPLIKEFPNLNIDAQSGLQENGALSIEKCRQYIINSLKLFQKYN